jgi:hypothetical protein
MLWRRRKAIEDDRFKQQETDEDWEDEDEDEIEEEKTIDVKPQIKSDANTLPKTPVKTVKANLNRTNTRTNTRTGGVLNEHIIKRQKAKRKPRRTNSDLRDLLLAAIKQYPATTYALSNKTKIDWRVAQKHLKYLKAVGTINQTIVPYSSGKNKRAYYWSVRT